jgi:hypothetical protein
MTRGAALAAAVWMVVVLPVVALAADVRYHLVGQPEVYTLVNLHPDEHRHRLYSVNYQQPGLIPLCTKVMIESVTEKAMVLHVPSTGRTYDYIFHNSMRDPIGKHLDKFFGTMCNTNRLDTMSEIDRRGISQGRALTGMSKEAVILAIGYPPEHVTPTLESNTWKYWRTRFATQLVSFVDGKVVDTRD